LRLTELGKLNSLTLAEKVGQLFVIGITGPKLDEATIELLAEIQPGGVCLFARNIKSLEQTRELLDAIGRRSKITPILAVDEEGGLVDRLRRVMTPSPAANKLGTAKDAADQAAIIGETLDLLGFNTDFAPVVDVVDAERAKHSNGLFSRAYGSTKEEVTDLAGAFLGELQARNITGCIKHFPGLGGARVDSHEDLPFVEITEAELSEVDLYPYRNLIERGDVRMIMVAHVAFPNHSLQQLGPDGKPLPASLSYNFVTTTLRGQFGYDGVVITDDLEMGAIMRNYGIGEACKMAVLAGNDLLAICAEPANIRTGFGAVLRAVESGEISEARLDESLKRIARLKERYNEPPALDLDRLEQLSAATEEFVARLA
jgi:beta-N-acetylhexosaminidase